MEPIRVLLFCPCCKAQHVDQGEWETRPHRVHFCEFCCAQNCKKCKHQWLASLVATVGVETF